MPLILWEAEIEIPTLTTWPTTQAPRTMEKAPTKELHSQPPNPLHYPNRPQANGKGTTQRTKEYIRLSQTQ